MRHSMSTMYRWRSRVRVPVSCLLYAVVVVEVDAMAKQKYKAMNASNRFVLPSPLSIEKKASPSKNVGSDP
jgi:hypothetical protein